MSQQPDKLFRDKLSGYQLRASGGAWDRVETHLRKKGRAELRLKVAAAVAFLIAAGVLIFAPGTKPAGTGAIVKIDKPSLPIVTDEPERVPEQSPEVNGGAVDPLTNSTHEPTVALPREAVKIPVSIKAPSSEKNHDPVETNADPLIVPELDVVENVTLADAGDAVNPGAHELKIKQAIDTSEGVTIVYTADEIHKKYLNKKEQPEATPAGESPSTLKKLLAKAYDLKHDQNAFGELRQKKNEIFALNFRSNQRSENK